MDVFTYLIGLDAFLESLDSECYAETEEAGERIYDEKPHANR